MLPSVLLISTYELGHQPFGLASPAAWLANAGAEVHCLDLAVQSLDEELVGRADLIALYLPMHTATRLAARLIPRLARLNPKAHLACFGLYAPTNETYLRRLGVETVLGGEFETGLVALWRMLGTNTVSTTQAMPTISLERQNFIIPDRTGLPRLDDYAQLVQGEERSLAGYTEASRGCKHTCRHCPIVPVYNGRFRIIQHDVVLADIRQQVRAGAEHITFGDPDFFNGPGHAVPLVQALHDEFPALTYDVTIKVEHLIKHSSLLPVLRDTGCRFITSAVEALDDAVLLKLDKGHTRADFEQAVGILKKLDLQLNPTFVAFTPWTSAKGFLEMLEAIQELDLVQNVAPIQYAIRLLIPSGSRLLELEDVQTIVEPFDEQALTYPWRHADPRLDQLHSRLFDLIRKSRREGIARSELFDRVWATTLDTFSELTHRYKKENIWDIAAKPLPRLSESWY